MRIPILMVIVICFSLLGGREERKLQSKTVEHNGAAFLAIHDFSKFEKSVASTPEEIVLTSPEFTTGMPSDEIIVSWNADAPDSTGLKIEARAFCEDHWTVWYGMGNWSKDGRKFPRVSISGQKDADGAVSTDTLTLTKLTDKIQLRVTLQSEAGSKPPTLKFLGVSLADTRAMSPKLEPNHAAWGREVIVPARPQSGWPGASGWCSPTSACMTLAFWAEKLKRPELDMPVPEVAHAIYDSVYDGTGNWPFNTAFAGSFPSIRAYVTRFTDIRELEDWVETDIPVIVSVSYDLLRGKQRDNDPGHLMVCDGFTAKGDIILNDPAFHPDRGEICRRIFPRAQFLRGWKKSRNTVYLIYPEDAKRPANKYGHWEN